MAKRTHYACAASLAGRDTMQNPQPGYAQRFDMPGYASALPIPFLRASLGGRTVAYLLDILFIFGFTVLLTLLITVVGVVTFGLGCSRSYQRVASSTARSRSGARSRARSGNG
jgi:hypothetical protein